MKQGSWPLEECLGSNSKELGRIRRPISVQKGGMTLGFRSPQRIELRTHYSRPRQILRMSRQVGRAVGRSIFEIELMRELMQHEIFAIGWIARAVSHRIPCEYESAKLARGVTEPMLRTFFPKTIANVPLRLFRVAARIDENRMQVRVVVRLAMKKKQASLRGDRHPDLIRQNETAAPLEMLLGEKDLNVLEKLRLIFRRKTAEDVEIVFDDLTPTRRERLSFEPLPAPAVE